jgi:hypothetical protein
MYAESYELNVTPAEGEAGSLLEYTNEDLFSYPAFLCYNAPVPLFRYLKLVNATRRLAKTLFPHEKWIKTGPHIWVADSRLTEKAKESDKWEREMAQVRILTGRGSVVYFLPEEKNEEKGKMYPDTVIDGEITELKTVSGNRSTLGTDFRQGYKQGAALAKIHTNTEKHSVFIRLLSDISVGSVKAKIAGELKNRTGNGHFICYFENTGNLYTWTYDELRGIIGKQIPVGMT